MAKPATLVQKIHFEDFSGEQFERLVFAYLLRTEQWSTLEWYGQVGADLGRDIWGEREDSKVKVCVQCANRHPLSYEKIRKDLDKIVSAPNGLPNEFILVAGSNLSARMRDKVKIYAKNKDIYYCSIWSGQEFEEMLRAKAESLLQRFVRGEAFPDSPKEIQSFLSKLEPIDDNEILTLMAGLFDRPAFYTPFNQESSIPAFKKAISDTIEALNTGIHRLRDGTEIRRIPSRHQVKDKLIRDTLNKIERMLSKLRATYDIFLRQGEIKPCGCGDPDCPVFFVSPTAAREMDIIRVKILNEYIKIYPPFQVHLMSSRWYI
ncbi:MAG: hypothetical protein JXA51_02740 [Dehalococcoidales bacterium]|nr:hypothetical protein [Dehalococcoidales bacterium]